ncbi:alpha-(1,3)-fucosyltransferase 7-like [Diadema antillarum]|uniref:alpha-(1,3)-fucosyltransferase 7-like n=1 Tax=Diadema antillarum TaxID=105358 RepID=UPI003A85CD65
MSRNAIPLSIICLSTIGCIVLWLTNKPAEEEQNQNKGLLALTRSVLSPGQHSNAKCTRQLQIWTDKRIGDYSSKPHVVRCASVPCDSMIVANNNISTTRVSDAVLLHPKTIWSWKDMHRARPRGQKWIFYGRDNPARTEMRIIPPEEYRDTSYDYIMSFRKGSDFSAEYGIYDETKPEVMESDSRNWADNRSGLVVWIETDCRSTSWKRTDFVKQLQSIISVDTFGDCGDKESCPTGSSCEAKLKTYKFYLSLENSRCRDFITQDFFYSLSIGVVPIVSGPPRIDYERVAPPDSFIHIDDFPSVQALAYHIDLLNKNDNMYNRYFEWKKLGSVVTVEEEVLLAPENMCQIFERMHIDEMRASVGLYKRPEMPVWTEWLFGSCSAG